jgi:hypothetical protein
MNTLVSNLERELLAPFREAAEKLCNEFRNVSANVYSQSVGALTEYQGHQIVIDCLLTDVPDDQPDNVSLSVELQKLSSMPKINADVCWGHPSGYIEAEFSHEDQNVSDNVLTNLHSQLPHLYEVLVEAVRRRKPSNWNQPHA